MCLATPQKVLKINGKSAIIETAKNQPKKIDLSLLSDQIKPGDFVLATHGLAIQKMSASDAREVLDLIEESHRSLKTMKG